jgi:hypothetical protein
VFARSPGEGSVTGRKKDQMIQVGAAQTERAFVFNESNPSFATEFFPALSTRGLLSGDEYFHIGGLLHVFIHRRSQQNPFRLSPALRRLLAAGQ